MGQFDNIYTSLPVFAQNIAVSLYGVYWRQLRFGPGYSQFVEQYRQREYWSFRQWQDWQSGQLASLLQVCSEHVPYYRETWTPAQKKTAVSGDLGALPLLEKEPLRANPRHFLNEALRTSRPQVFLTSGSTGTPISSYYTIPELRQSLALREVRSAGWAGVSFKMPRATFSGRMVEPDPASKGPYYRFNAAERQVYFSPFHLRPDTAQQYVDALNRHRIEWGTGYAVSYYLLARFMIEKEIAPPSHLKAIITTSEKLTAEMRVVMEKAYGCQVYEEYSTVENAIFASECEHGRLHVSPDVSVVEILRPDGTACLPGEAGAVVVTSLAKTYQPLIRFRLGDVAVWDAEPCPCGCQMPVIKEVVGRIEDVVIGPDGRQMVRFHGVFVNQPHIREGQVIQEALNCIRIKIVPLQGFSSVDEHDLIQRVQQRLGCEVQVIVEPVDSIPRSKAGKFKAVLSLLKDGS